jgi:hypothetical protein
MLRKHFVHTAAIGCLVFSLLPAIATAQSAITGTVSDSGGGVLPGVTVEAASPALIEKIRTALTDAEGRYTIANLRPGLYKVTFTLTGFGPFVRDGLALPSDFTATVNAELRVGTLEETITVSGQAPVVDVSRAERTTVISRDLIDSVPTGRTFAAVGALAVGIRVSEPNVGGARTGTQQRLLAYGSLARDTTIAIDGMKSGLLEAGGDDANDHNDGMTAEVTVQTSGQNAEVARGGPYINLIPREGGNILSGATYFGFTNRSMQSDNLGELRQRGLNNPDSVDKIYYANVSLGGPIKRDKLWFFGSFGKMGNYNIIANSSYPDGRPGIYDHIVTNGTLRLTWQVNSKNKITAFDDHQDKKRPHQFTSGADVATASTVRNAVQKYDAAVKWTSTLSNKLLLETGYLFGANTIGNKYQPGIKKAVDTPEWYATASRVDINRGTTTVAPAGAPDMIRFNHSALLASSVSYVTGAHSFKTGVQWFYGEFIDAYERPNADLTQRYRDFVPDSVIVLNTPVSPPQRLNADLGIFVQDSWQVSNRLTIAPGVRFEYLNASIVGRALPPGRFVPYREFPDVPNLPNWFNVSPRFGAAYDVTGDTRTALKGTINRYYRNATVDIANLYDPGALQMDTRNWSDCDYLPGTSTCSTRVLPTNRDNIAQDNEIGPSNNRRFGIAPDRHFDPESKRPFDMEYTLGLEREVMSGLSVGAIWFRRETYNLQQTINRLVDVSDYAAFQVASPLNGELLTVYNLNPAKQGLVDLLDTTADRSKARFSYQGMEFTFRGRLRGGGNVLGGWSAGKSVRVSCANLSDPNTFRDCDQSQLDIPFRHTFKIAGSHPIPLGLTVGATLLSAAGSLLGSNVQDGSLATNWAVPANLFPGGRTQAVTVRLDKPGSQWLDRLNQLDIEFKRPFRVGKYQFEPTVDVYNVFNSNVVLQQNQNFGTSLGTPQRILQGRLLRIAAQTKF